MSKRHWWSGKVWIDVGSWTLIQMLVSYFFLLVKEKQEKVCWVWHSFDYFLWGLRVFSTWSWKWKDWGEVGGKVLSYTLCVLVSASSQNFGGTGHDLFIDNNCCRTSKGHTAKPETLREHFEGLCSQMKNGKDGTQQLLGSSSQTRQECQLSPVQ